MLSKKKNISSLYKRVPYFDNLKFFLILLVVIGHTSDLLMESSRLMGTIRIGIYSFHMPLFVYISGYFADGKNFDIKKNSLKIINLFGWYILFKIGLFLEHLILLGEDHTKLSLFVDGGAPWYLFALIIWHILIPYVKIIDVKKALVLIIGISLIAGCEKNIGDYMSLSRILAYGVFFYGGMFAKQKDSKFFVGLEKKHRLASMAILITLCMFIYYYYDIILRFVKFQSARYSYHVSNVNNFEGIILRGALLIIAFVVGFLFLCCIPAKNKIYTMWGKRTMQIYILHTFIYVYFINNKGLILEMGKTFQGKIFVLLISVIITILLANRWINFLYDKITNLFKLFGNFLISRK